MSINLDGRVGDVRNIRTPARGSGTRLVASSLSSSWHKSLVDRPRFKEEANFAPTRVIGSCRCPVAPCRFTGKWYNLLLNNRLRDFFCYTRRSSRTVKPQ